MSFIFTLKTLKDLIVARCQKNDICIIAMAQIRRNFCEKKMPWFSIADTLEPQVSRQTRPNEQAISMEVETAPAK